MRVEAIIPALDEEDAIGPVVRGVPSDLIERVIVVDNGSKDATAKRAREAGAKVVDERERGYGAACLKGIASLDPQTEAVLFLDGDGSDDLSRLPEMLALVESGGADLVIGSRTLGEAEPGAMTLPQHAGNLIAGSWLRMRFGIPASDLGPLRLIRRTSLERLQMEDRNYGWTVEMQIKAAQRGLDVREVSVPYRRRQAGESKVSGTLRGTIGASVKILGLLAYYDLRGVLRR